MIIRNKNNLKKILKYVRSFVQVFEQVFFILNLNIFSSRLLLLNFNGRQKKNFWHLNILEVWQILRKCTVSVKIDLQKFWKEKIY